MNFSNINTFLRTNKKNFYKNHNKEMKIYGNNKPIP